MIVSLFIWGVMLSWISLLAYIFYAFTVGWWWGVLCIVFFPVGIFLFAILNWKQARFALLRLFLAQGLLVYTLAAAYGHSGRNGVKQLLDYGGRLHLAVWHLKPIKSVHRPSLSRGTIPVNEFKPQRVLLPPTKVDLSGSEREALIQAVRYGDIAVVRYLLDRGGDVHLRTSPQGPTILMEAVAFGYEDIVTLLLERGADPAAKDFSGRDALALARQHGRRSLAALLEQKTA